MPPRDDGGDQDSAADLFLANERRKTREIAEEVVAAHIASEEHTRPRGLMHPLFVWDSGEDGTALTASSTRPNGWYRVRVPRVFNSWFISGDPDGSATVVVKLAAPGIAKAAATVLCTCTLVGGESEQPDFAPITIEAGSRMAAFLTAVSTCEVVAISLEDRRT